MENTIIRGKVPLQQKPTKQQKNWTPTSIVVNPTPVGDHPQNPLVRKAIAYKYYGLKINEEVLKIKDKTILEVVCLLGIEDGEYVIGRDDALSVDAKPHYHIHFKDARTLDALQKHKQRVMPEWGRTTKLYPPKDRVDNIMCWYGYAVKEQLIYASETVDKVILAQEAHTQAAYKKSQMNYGKQQQEKKQAKMDLQTTIFTQLDNLPIPMEFYEVAVWVSIYFYEEVKCPPIKSQIEKYTWTYLLERGFKSHQQYISWQFPNRI